MNRMFRSSAAHFSILTLTLALLAGFLPVGTAEAAETWTSCTPVNVSVYSVGSKRIHVKCAQAVNGIRFFALSSSDSALMGRVLSLITSAQIGGRTLSILYDPADLSGQAWGCANSDCRILRAAGFGQ
ncbi:MAG TPA: hypothetical protein VF179_15225 [Thermoanaerobaculia bacterium]|nr:hypothetical protein [Thermoanaerobaculia bacterium]